MFFVQYFVGLLSSYKLELSQKQFGHIIFLNVVSCGRTWLDRTGPELHAEEPKWSDWSQLRCWKADNQPSLTTFTFCLNAPRLASVFDQQKCMLGHLFCPLLWGCVTWQSGESIKIPIKQHHPEQHGALWFSGGIQWRGTISGVGRGFCWNSNMYF